MPGWFLIAAPVTGAIFVAEAGISLLRGKPLVPPLFGRGHRSKWELWFQLIAGIDFFFAPVSTWPSSPTRTAATVLAVFVWAVGITVLIVGIISDVRANATHSNA